jgi:hypothetical protein
MRQELAPIPRAIPLPIFYILSRLILTVGESLLEPLFAPPDEPR